MRKRHTPEQIIVKLREAEIALSKGQPLARIVRKLGITEQANWLRLRDFSHAAHAERSAQRG